MYGLSLGVGARHCFESHVFGLEVDGHLDPSAGPVGNTKWAFALHDVAGEHAVGHLDGNRSVILLGTPGVIFPVVKKRIEAELELTCGNIECATVNLRVDTVLAFEEHPVLIVLGIGGSRANPAFGSAHKVNPSGLTHCRIADNGSESDHIG